MTRLKVVTIVGTRPEIIRLSETIRACDKSFDHVLVHTGQNWDNALNKVFFDELELRKPDYSLSCAGETLGETMGNILSQSYALLEKERPDALLVLGDTNSALSAISAKRLKIPIFHMEAGNRCFDQNVPEETNRRIVDVISDVNLPYTEHSRRNLLSEGIKTQYVFVTGSPMREVLEKNKGKIENSNILDQLQLVPKHYMVASIHREENIETPAGLSSLMETLNHAAERYQMPVVYSVHPRSRKRIVENQVKFHPFVRCLPPFGFLDYVKLEKNAFCVLSDSGTVCEESTILGFPAVLLRTSTERPEAIEQGTVVIGGVTPGEVESAIETVRDILQTKGPFPAPPDYLCNDVSRKVVRMIESYTKIVQRDIWHK